MKNRRVFFALILSLAFNVAFLGTLGYRLLNKGTTSESSRHRVTHDQRSSRERIKFSKEQKERLKQLREHFYPRIKAIRSELVNDRKALVDLLMEDKPDSLQIEKSLNRLGQRQMELEREVVYQLLKEKEVLPPELRQHYLNMVMKRLGGNLYRTREHSKNGRRGSRSEKSQDKKNREEG